MKHSLIIGNWKLHGNKNSIIHFLNTLNNKLINISQCHIIIAPPLIYLDTANNHLLNINSDIKLCAQNVSIHLSGAFTGDTSALMLKDIGIQYVLIGHSEHRMYYSETDLHVSKKFSILKKHGLIPILCIGENKKDHDNGIAELVCIKQIDSIIKSIGVQSFQNSIIAYEPTWAIGSGLNASPQEVQLIHKSIRNHIAQYDQSIANQILIHYGGSVNSDNVIQFILQKDIDGILIGSASMEIDHFSIIIQLIENSIKNIQ